MAADIIELSTEIRWPRYPYPGLRPFRMNVADESLIFHGRDGHRDEVAARLNASQFVSVVGPSGCGKSSLVKVGLIPMLKAGLLTRAGYDWTSIEMRPGKDPIGNLIVALGKLRDAGCEMDTQDISDLLWKRRSALWMIMENFAEALEPESPTAKPRRVLLLLDQFEEIFSDGCDPRAVDQFVLLLTQFFRNPHPQLFVVLTMRTDFISQCANFPGLAEILNETQYITPVLRDQDLRDAIQLPAEKYWGEVEPALVDAIVADMGTGAKYDADHLPLMQHALLWLWRQAWPRTGLVSPPDPGMDLPERTSRVCLTLAEYEAHGRLQGILNQHADALFDSVAAADDSGRKSAIAETMFRRLSERDSDGRYKRAPAYAHEVCEIARCTPDDLDEVIEPFERDASFVERRRGLATNDPLLDLSHESLIRQWGRFHGWADNEAEKLTHVRQYVEEAESWVRLGRSRGLLKSGLQLGIFRLWWNSNRPTAAWAGRYRLRQDGAESLAASLPLVDEFLAASIFKRKRNVALAAGSSVALLAILGFFVGQHYQDKIQAQKDIVAHEQKMRDDVAATVGFAFLARHEPDKALQVAQWLFSSHPSTDVRQARLLAGDALRSLHEAQVIDTGSPVYSLDYSPDGRWLLASASGLPQLWQIATSKGMPLLGSDPTTYWRVAFSPHGGQVLLTSQDRSTVLVPVGENDAGDTAVLGSVQRLDESEKVGMGLYSGDGRRVITGAMGAPLRLWDANTHALIAKSDNAVEGFWSTTNVDGSLIAVPHSGTSDQRGVDIYRTDEDLKLIRLVQFVSAGAPVVRGASSCNVSGQPTVRALAFHPKDPRLLVFAIACRVFVVDAETARPLFRLDGQVADVSKVVFSGDGKRIATGDEEGTVRIYDLPAYDLSATEQAPRVIDGPVILGKHDGTVFDLRFSPDGQYVASGGRDRTVRIWNLESAIPADAHPEIQAELPRLVLAHLPKNIKQLNDLDLCLIGDADKCRSGP